MLDGRVKTLHPKVHGGIQARRDLPEHVATMTEHGMPYIDLVCVNLYPFVATVSKPHTLDDAIENIDIGGPAMVRSSAKKLPPRRHRHRPRRYHPAGGRMQANGGRADRPTRSRGEEGLLPYRRIRRLLQQLPHRTQRQQRTRAFGEKTEPAVHPRAGTCRLSARTRTRPAPSTSRPKRPAARFHTARQIQARSCPTKTTSPTHDAALECVKRSTLHRPASSSCTPNPLRRCQRRDPVEAYDRETMTDPESAFGGIIAFNGRLDGATAAAIASAMFVEHHAAR